jgi:hypothetical protein
MRIREKSDILEALVANLWRGIFHRCLDFRAVETEPTPSEVLLSGLRSPISDG